MPVIERASPADAATLRNLLQLYLYDLGDFGHGDLDAEGRFGHEPVERYLEGDRRAAFLARISGKPAAFALVSEHSVLNGEGCGVRTISDLFVLRRHRRKGLGAWLALDVFRRFPGRWEVRQEVPNEPAQAFWRTVIARYTAGRFVELVLDDHRWRGPVQTFDNSLMVG